jgi:O-antigen/teichoic acid export membrane protein
MESHAGTGELPKVTASAAAPSGTPSRIGRNVAALGAGQIVTWTMTCAWTLVVPRLIGPAGMGLIVSAWSITGILAIALGLGTRNYLVRAIVVERNRASALLASATVLRLLLAPLFLAAVFVYAQFAGHGHGGRLVLYLAAGATIFTLLAEPMQAAFQAFERMEYLAYSDVVSKSAQGLLGIALAVLGFGAVGFAGCWMVMSGVVIVLDILWLRRYVRLELRSTLRRLIRMVRESVSYWAFGLFFMIYLWIDAAMLSLMTNSTVVGWYGVPTKLFQTMMFVPVIVSTAWLPRLVSAFEESPQKLHRLARTPIELVLLVGLPIAAAVAAAAGPIVHILYGPAYGHSVPVMIVLGLCIPPMYLNIMFAQVLIAAKRQAVWTWAMAGATVVNPAINAVLIPVTQARFHNGAIGAAISLLVTELLIAGFGFAFLGRAVLSRHAGRRLALTAVASTAMWGVAFVLSGLGTVPSLAAAALTFVVLAAIFRLVTREEMVFIRDRLRRIAQRLPDSLRRRMALAPLAITTRSRS